jgi:pteridine reductase
MNKVALITGAAKRIGAGIADRLHRAGLNVVIHYHHSAAEARELTDRLNALRPDSAIDIGFALEDSSAPERLVETAVRAFGRLDVLINNASIYRPTPVGTITQAEWNELVAVNLAAPLFLAQAAAPQLRRQRGTIINIADIYGERPRRDHPVYSITKAGLIMLTHSLAIDLAPEIRVNAIAPGAILWPEHGTPDQELVLAATPLRRRGASDDIAQAIEYLVAADFITGQVLAIDGGRLLTI